MVRLVDAVIIGMGYVGLPLAREATTTPLPLAADLVRSENIGLEVPWDDPGAVVEAILKLRAEPELRSQLGGNGHKVAQRDYDWNHLSADFVQVMDRVADRLRDHTQTR